jgi:hypothetical protein
MKPPPKAVGLAVGSACRRAPKSALQPVRSPPSAGGSVRPGRATKRLSCLRKRPCPEAVALPSRAAQPASRQRQSEGMWQERFFATTGPGGATDRIRDGALRRASRVRAKARSEQAAWFASRNCDRAQELIQRRLLRRFESDGCMQTRHANAIARASVCKRRGRTPALGYAVFGCCSASSIQFAAQPCASCGLSWSWVQVQSALDESPSSKTSAW